MKYQYLIVETTNGDITAINGNLVLTEEDAKLHCQVLNMDYPDKVFRYLRVALAQPDLSSLVDRLKQSI